MYLNARIIYNRTDGATKIGPEAHPRIHLDSALVHERRLKFIINYNGRARKSPGRIAVLPYTRYDVT